jgi:hypothetical protein
MRNFKITAGGALKKRAGSKNVVKLSEGNEVKALWSGYMGENQVLCAACDGKLWKITCESGEWTANSQGELDTSDSVFMFSFSEKLYIMNGKEYKVWDGESLTNVEGYRPLVSIATLPTGGGTSLEQVNKLNGLRRCWFSPDGEADTFLLPESGIKSVDWVKSLVTGENLTDYTVDLEAGTIKFSTAPDEGINTIEVAWTYPINFRDSVQTMRYAESYNGTTDNRVFIYGNGSNKAFYSGLDYDGKPRADYFPDMNEVEVGLSSTPITAMIRHYDRLLCFKEDSTWSLIYDTMILSDGGVAAGVYVIPINRDVGNCVFGGAQLVENRPRTIDGKSVIEWKATSSSGNVTGDQRNAQRVSQRVMNTIGKMKLSTARTFYEKVNHEYYVIDDNGTALVNNVENDTWYVYTGFDAKSIISYEDEVYFGTSDGYICHFSDEYLSDNEKPIDAFWESGAMDFGMDFKRKYSAMLWVGIKPEENGYLEVTAQTDRKSEFAVYSSSTGDAGAVPEMDRIKLKAKKFTYYKLILSNNTLDKTATVVSADVRVRATGYVR